MPAPLNSGQFKCLRSQARTAEDFKALSKWCRQRAETYRKKKEDCEAELREYYSRPSPLALAKYPPRDKSLKALIAHYRELSARWSELENLYSKKAQDLAAAKAQE